MEMRSDFRGVEDLINRLREYAKQFATYNSHEWPYLKNQTDFTRVYRLPPEIRGPLERVYADGGDLAVGMIYLLGEFNEVGMYPTFKSYVAGVEETVESYLAKAREVIPNGEKAISDSPEHPRASEQMIILYKTQVGILESLRDEWIPRAENSRLYKEESGELHAVSRSEPQPWTQYNTAIFEGNVGQAQVQQATHSSTQSVQSAEVDVDKLARLIESLKDEVEKISVSQAIQNELRSEIATLEAQVTSPKPKHIIIKESLSTVRRILEGAGGTVAAHLILQLKDIVP
jgi:hypothetical protein